MSMFTPEEQAQLIELSRRFTRNLEKLVREDQDESSGQNTYEK